MDWPDNRMLVDGVLAFTLLEGLVLLGWHRATGRGLAPPDTLSCLLPGVCLLLAARSLAAHAGGDGPTCALWLAVAGAAHAADLWRRWLSPWHRA